MINLTIVPADPLVKAMCIFIVGAIIVGVTGDEVSAALSADVKDMMLNILGVDLETLVYRGKFVFVALVGRPQKVVIELRDNSPPDGFGVDVLIAGGSKNPGAITQ